MDDVAELVTEDLELDVARTSEILLDVDFAVTERGQRLGARELEGAGEVVGILGDTHPLSAAARGRLDDDGKSDLLRELERLVDIVDTTGRPGNDRDTNRGHR